MVFWHAMIGLCNFRHFYITARDVRKLQRCEITNGSLFYQPQRFASSSRPKENRSDCVHVVCDGSTGESGTILADHCLVALGQLADELVALGGLDGFQHFPVGGASATQADVFHYRVLEYHEVGAQESLWIHRGYIWSRLGTPSRL